MNNKTVKKGLLPYIFLLLFIIICLLMFNNFNKKVNELTYDKFIKELESNEITELSIIPKISSNTYEIQGNLEGYAENETFTLMLPQSDEFISKISDAADNNDFKLTVKKDPSASEWLAYIIELIPLTL